MKRFMLAGMLCLHLGQTKHVDDFRDTLIYKIGAADEQHEVSNGKTVVVRAKIKRKNWRGHVHEIRCEAQKDYAHNERAGKTEFAADVLLLFRQTVRGNGDKDEIVDAQDDFEENQRDEADPRFGRGEDGKIHSAPFIRSRSTDAQNHDPGITNTSERRFARYSQSLAI